MSVTLCVTFFLHNAWVTCHSMHSPLITGEERDTGTETESLPLLGARAICSLGY